MNNNALQIFTFESHEIRIVSVDGEPRFVAKDVADKLGYVWKGIATIEHVPEKWRGVYSVQTPRGPQDMLTFSEQGMYFFLIRSDKSLALPMQEWFAGEVMPAIRKTGSYSVPGAQLALPYPTVDNADWVAQQTAVLAPGIRAAARSMGLRGKKATAYTFAMCQQALGVNMGAALPPSEYVTVPDDSPIDASLMAATCLAWHTALGSDSWTLLDIRKAMAAAPEDPKVEALRRAFMVLAPTEDRQDWDSRGLGYVFRTCSGRTWSGLRLVRAGRGRRGASYCVVPMPSHPRQGLRLAT